jgi:hypothetical protein
MKYCPQCNSKLSKAPYAGSRFICYDCYDKNDNYKIESYFEEKTDIWEGYRIWLENYILDFYHKEKGSQMYFKLRANHLVMLKIDFCTEKAMDLIFKSEEQIKQVIEYHLVFL